MASPTSRARRIIAAAAAAVALLAASCSQQSDPASPAPAAAADPQPAPSTTAAPGPATTQAPTAQARTGDTPTEDTATIEAPPTTQSTTGMEDEQPRSSEPSGSQVDKDEGTAEGESQNDDSGSGIAPDDSGPPMRPVYGLVFASDGVATIVDADGTELLHLPDGGFHSRPQWSPDGSRILVEEVDGEGWPRLVSIYSVDLVGNVASLYSQYWGALSDYRWSPDSSHIVFHNFADRHLPEGLFVVDAEASDVRRLTDHGSKPAWSPDGIKIAYDLGSDSVGILIVDADGRNVTQLTDHGSKPAWSPDGIKIAYDLGFDSVGILVVDANGRNVTQLTDHGHSPVWSPDGSKIAYDLGFDVGIRVVDADGRNVTQLTDHGHNPVWSPDGSMIAFNSWLDGDWEVLVMDSDGSNIRQLTDNTRSNSSPMWSPVPMMTVSEESP